MKSKTLDTALLSLSVGCLVIGIYEVIARGLNFAYLWLMLSVVLWLSYSFRKRTASAAAGDSASADKPSKENKQPSGRPTGAKSSASKPGRKRK